jgi:hypothetical protein
LSENILELRRLAASSLLSFLCNDKQVILDDPHLLLIMDNVCFVCYSFTTSTNVDKCNL